jgi:hypothetical protein
MTACHGTPHLDWSESPPSDGQRILPRGSASREVHHAYLVGVADPTEEIPAGFLFVTGLNNKNNKHPRSDKVFITRYPCLEASDAKIFALLVAKPCRVSQAYWEWLQELPFGAVVFGNPKTKVETTLS